MQMVQDSPLQALQWHFHWITSDFWIVIEVIFYNPTDPARFQSYKQDNYPTKGMINCYGLILSTYKTYSNYLGGGTVSSRYSKFLIYAPFGQLFFTG